MMIVVKKVNLRFVDKIFTSDVDYIGSPVKVATFFRRAGRRKTMRHEIQEGKVKRTFIQRITGQTMPDDLAAEVERAVIKLEIRKP